MQKLFHIELVDLEWHGRCLRCGYSEKDPSLPAMIHVSRIHAQRVHDDEPLVCGLFVRGKELATLARAPEGFIWKWETPEQAHLVQHTIDNPGHRAWKGVCGQPAWGIHLAYLIGGYSARPCNGCLAALNSPVQMDTGSISD